MTVPSEDEYITMVSNKTGGLIRLAARLLQSASSTKHDVVPLSELIGRIFQIRDDYNNLCSEKVIIPARQRTYKRELTKILRWLPPKAHAKT